MNAIGLNLRPMGGEDAATTALVARMTTAPTTKHRRAINRLIVALKASGAWAAMDALYVLAAQDEPEAKLNWIADAYNLTETGSVTFDAYEGYTPDGSTTFLDTGFNPVTAGGKFTQNDAHLGSWCLTNNLNGASASNDIGNERSRIGVITGTMFIRPNLTSPKGTGSLATHVTWVRTASNVWRFYSGGVDVQGGTDASNSLTSYNFGIGRTGAAAFGVNQAAIVHFGSSLTAPQVASAHAAFRAYLTEMGAI